MGFDYRTYTGLGKQTLGGHKQKLVCTRTREKGAGTPQGTDPGLPAGVQESLAEAWVDSVLLARSGALRAVVPACNLWKEEAIIFITSTLVWFSQQQGGTQLRPSTENWIKHLLGMVPPIRTRLSFPTVSLSQQEASISLLYLSFREQTE